MTKRILVLGAGVAGAQALHCIHKQFHHNPHYSLMVVDRQNYTAFAPMLHEVATGAVYSEHVTHPIRQILHCCLETFRNTEVKGLDLEQKLVVTADGPIRYDYLIVALGARTNFFGVPGAKEHSLELKTMDDALALRRRMLDAFEQATKLPSGEARRELLHFVVVGGGYTGVELAGQLSSLFFKEFRALYPEILPDEPRITLVHASDRLLPMLKPVSSARAQLRLERLGVTVMTNARVTTVTEKGVILQSGEVIPAGHVVWASGVEAVGGQFFKTEMVEKGRVKVKSTLQIPNFPEVFVIGDLAAVTEGNGPHPQTAQAAFEQALLVAKNLRALIDKQPLAGFHYRHKGDLVPIGDRWAIAEVFGLRFTGFLGWWLRRTVYLRGLFSWNDRIRVVFDWTMNLFSKRDTTRL